jgi:CubicO group peptidase (beta-lactamase class C family)
VPAFDTVGATSLFTTVGDLVRWVQGFWEARLLGGAIVEQLLAPGRRNDGEVLPYAFGVVLGEYRSARIVEHSGGDAGYRSHLLWLPDQHFAVAVLGNHSELNPAALARQVTDVYLGVELAPVPAPPAPARVPATELARLTGLYGNAKSGELWQLALVDGTLTNVLGWRFALEPRWSSPHPLPSPSMLACTRVTS